MSKNKLGLKKVENGYLPWRYMRNWFSNLKTYFRSIKHKRMRAKYGIAPSDCWDLDSYIIQTILNGLKLYREDANGFPTDMTEDEWHAVLAKMTNDFERYFIDMPNPYQKQFDDIHPIMQETGKLTWTPRPLNEEEQKIVDLWKAAEQEEYDAKWKTVREGFELLSKYLPNLWW